MGAVSADAIQSLEQLETVWCMCVEDRGTGEVRDEPTLAVRWADNAFPVWNAMANILDKLTEPPHPGTAPGPAAA